MDNFETTIETTRRYVTTDHDSGQPLLKVIAKRGAGAVKVKVYWSFLPDSLSCELAKEVGRVLLEAGTFACRRGR